MTPPPAVDSGSLGLTELLLDFRRVRGDFRWGTGDFLEGVVVVLSDWFDVSRKFRKDEMEGNVDEWELKAELVDDGIGEAFGIFGTEPLSFLGSSSLLTQERIFSLSTLSCDKACDVM